MPFRAGEILLEYTVGDKETWLFRVEPDAPLGAFPMEALAVEAGTNWRAGPLEFPPMPDTRQTIDDLAALFGVEPRKPRVLLDVNATESDPRRADLSSFRYLFFGTHGLQAAQFGAIQERVLVLTQVGNEAPDDGFLTFSEVLDMKLDSDLVTLAACMTGVGQVMRGEGTLNFARAFLQAGARSVVVAVWNIPVDESMAFYREFYRNLKEGKSKLEAMRAARKAVRAKEPHPYFWAGFILHGEG